MDWVLVSFIVVWFLALIFLFWSSKRVFDIMDKEQNEFWDNYWKIYGKNGRRPE